MLLKCTLLLFLGVCVVASPVPSNEAFARSEFLDSDKTVRLRWTAPDKEGLVTFELRVRRPGGGWVGVGFSPSGGMHGADLVVAWLDDEGNPKLLDLHSIRTQPFKDEQQDYELLELTQDEEETTFVFRRAVDTCDDGKDLVFNKDTVSVLFATANHGEAFDEQSFASYHGFTNRGVKSLRLLDKGHTQPPVGDDVYNIDYVFPPTPIPQKDTSYWCRITQAPQIDVRQHALGFEEIIPKESEPYVHHIAVYGCHHKNQAELDNILGYMESHKDGSDCFEFAWQFAQCEEFIAVWTVGNKGVVFPEDAGFPIPAEGEQIKYWRMELHYENPEMVPGLMDTSGIRFYGTKKLREHDLGMFMVGNQFDYSIVLPPGEEQFSIATHCPVECLEAGLPEEGYKVVANNFHGHLQATGMRLRHFRGTTEMPMIDADEHYDFDYQVYREYDRPYSVILPGDSLTLECDYQTVGVKNTTISGWGTADEMCLSFIMVYPIHERNLWKCQSSPILRDLNNEIFALPPNSRVANELSPYEYQIVVGDREARPTDIQYPEYLSRVMGWTPNIRRNLRSFLVEGEKQMLCSRRDETPVTDLTDVRGRYPEGHKFYDKSAAAVKRSSVCQNKL